MTNPPPPPRKGKKLEPEAHPSLGFKLAAFITWYLFITPAVMIMWNVGLEPAGIVGRQINWLTAFALAMSITLVSNLLSRSRRA